MSSDRRRLPHLSVIWLILTTCFGVILGGYLTATLSTAHLPGMGLWLRDFAQSPGAAGCAALIAALIAFIGISRQVSVSRAQLEQQRSAARSESWWAMFEWATDRAIPPRKDDEPLSRSVSISTLERLAEDATSPVQKAACSGIIDLLSEGFIAEKKQPPTVDSADNIDEAGDGGDPALAALESYVESNRDTPAASAVAEALIYENNVSKALYAISWGSNSGMQVHRNVHPDGGVDAIAEVDERRVLVEIKAIRSAIRMREVVRNIVAQTRARSQGTDPLLIITPQPSPLSFEEETQMRVVVAQWRGPQDTDSLGPALRRASVL